MAEIVAAERVEGADRLLRLQIDLGSERRQLVAGIAAFLPPEQLVGRKIVVVANLAPARIRGVESQGMLLAAGGRAPAAPPSACSAWMPPFPTAPAWSRQPAPGRGGRRIAAWPWRPPSAAVTGRPPVRARRHRADGPDQHAAGHRREPQVRGDVGRRQTRAGMARLSSRSRHISASSWSRAVHRAHPGGALPG